ncbi:unnamed protein product [Agarophyton chilense]
MGGLGRISGPPSVKQGIWTLITLLACMAKVCGAHELHEMGHIFGLEHNGPENDCMQLGFYKSDAPNGGFCDFSESNRAIVRQKTSDWLILDRLDDTPECQYMNACDTSMNIRVQAGNVFADSCGASYQVQPDCSLERE